MEGLCEVASLTSASLVVNAVVGTAGLLPTLAALECGKNVAMANKEALVVGGELIVEKARLRGCKILPIDSEHSAIFQCLDQTNLSSVSKIFLTASGGPFFGKTKSELKNVTVSEALNHPKWKMGRKISIDSATLMNKGLEFVEAMHLFGVTPDDIQVVVHPQSVIHSMVELVDGTVIAQLGVPDMGLPIQFALTYPERKDSMFARMDFWHMKDMTFEAPDLENTPCLALAMDAARTGGTAPCIMSAANEVAVHAFLDHKLGYNRIYDAAAGAIEAVGVAQHPDLEPVLEADAAARRYVKETYKV